MFWGATPYSGLKIRLNGIDLEEVFTSPFPPRATPLWRHSLTCNFGESVLTRSKLEVASSIPTECCVGKTRLSTLSATIYCCVLTTEKLVLNRDNYLDMQFTMSRGSLFFFVYFIRPLSSLSMYQSPYFTSLIFILRSLRRFWFHLV